ncbi:MAG: hypothetical protein LDL53_13370 [Candidatus Hydrogenedens sp.]|nr:hypothetical protein [Candidatus Hydrogenedens sp.]
MIYELRRSIGMGIDGLVGVLKPFILHVNRLNIVRCLHWHGVIEAERET